MRFFEKLFGSVPNSDENNDYARATLEFATSREINKSSTIVDNNQSLILKDKVKYGRAISGYPKALEIKPNTAKAVMKAGVVGLQEP
jgi:tetratricopeptide (TPR) repeat protein